MHALKPQASSKVAVILNANAKRVTPRIRARIAQQCEGIDVYYSRSLEEARFINKQVLESGYSTVLTGGGDGTIVQTINSLYSLTERIPERQPAVQEERHLKPVPATRKPLPAIGVLKLGTGNALASVVGAGRYDQDVARIRQMMESGLEPMRMRLPLIESEGTVFPFAGLGWDATVLNDYNRLKESARSAPTRAICKSVLGYLIAAFSMTVPRMAVSRPPEVEVRTLADASLLGPDGKPIKRYAPGELLHVGPVNMLAFATIPYYGYEFTMFPFARQLRNEFQLRMAATGIPEVVSHLPGLWKGTYRSPRLLDFHCRKITMTFSRQVPYQVGGEAMGTRESLTVGMSDYPVELVDYRTALEPASVAASRWIPRPIS